MLKTLFLSLACMAAVAHAGERLEDRLKYLWDFDLAPNGGGVDLSNRALSAGAKAPGTQTLGKNGTQYLNYTTVSNGGKFGTSYNASNTGTYPKISNASGIGLTYQEGFTVSMWIKPTNVISWGDYFTIGTSSRTGGATNYLYMQSGGSNKYNVYGNGLIGTGGESTASITQNVWNHIALTYQNGVATLFMNGEQAGQWSGTPIANANVTQFTLGNGDSAAKPTAMYDEVALFSGALTKDQVGYLAQGRVSDAIKAENAAVPEPATATLSLLSLAGLMLRRRRMA